MFENFMNTDNPDFHEMVDIIQGKAPVTQEFKSMAKKFSDAINEWGKRPMDINPNDPVFPMDFVGEEKEFLDGFEEHAKEANELFDKAIGET